MPLRRAVVELVGESGRRMAATLRGKDDARDGVIEPRVGDAPA